MNPDSGNPDPREFAAACGLFCGGQCTLLYIGATAEREPFERIAERFGVTSEECRCL